MEAFLYRCHPQTTRLVEIIREGVIGDVRVIQAGFSFHTTFNPQGRLFDPALGGGGILDVGCYPMSIARLIAGVAAGRDFAEPDEVLGAAQLGATGIDEWAVATLKFPGGVLAQLQTGVSVGGENVVRVFGSEGQLLIPSPWLPGRDGTPARIVVRRRDEAEPREIVIEAPADPYAVEADAFAAAIPAGVAPPPAMGPDDSLGNMRALDRWRAAIRLVYPAERLEAPPPPVRVRPLDVRKGGGPAMRYGRLPGSDKPASRLVMGVDNQRTMPHAAVMFDDFFERGGTTFDTAWQYGGGVCEELLGRWVEARGVREGLVIIGKGAHTPNCNPAAVTTQLFTSLERLRTEYVDLYLLHRDNPAIPVGEFIDVLNEHQRAGRMRAFGASNWSIERIEAANEYARSHGLAGFAVVSNNFSLARMVEPVWAGCIAASDTRSRAWFAETQ
ncbi:MAG: Putative oxidoreductase, partial [uncultured Thermomicrobiales bacterium]